MTTLAGRAAKRAAAALQRVREAYLAQLEALLAPAAARDRQAVGALMFLTNDTLQALSSPTTTAPQSLYQQLLQRETAGHRVAELIADITGQDSTDVLAQQCRQLLDDLTSQLNREDLPVCVATMFGPSRLVDYLRANMVMLVGLAESVGEEPETAIVAEVTRNLCSVLAERFPGRTIEVRVPPFAAVQVGGFGEGPIHTRGTPPNVVEMDAGTFLALARGRLAWPQAVADGRLRFSGVHAAETERMLPLVRL